MIVRVRFNVNGKLYAYNTNVKLLIGGVYDIIVDGEKTYSSHVKVYQTMGGTNKNLYTITDAKCIEGPPRPRKEYKEIIVNKEKETVCVVWRDGTSTVMKPHNEEFDAEKGIALCFMKKAYDNRGCFNEAFKDVTEV